MEKCIEGRKLMLFISGETGYHTIALATNHTLNISADSIDASNKDAGAFNKVNISKVSWDCSCDALYSYNSGATQETYDTLFGYMVDNKEIDVIFGLSEEVSTTATYRNGLLSGDWDHTEPQYGGKAVVTGLSLNASDNEMASMNITLSGSGPLAKVTV